MWIESHQSLRNHPKVIKAARLAGVSRVEIIGRLHYFWWWALDYARDGDITKYDDADIESAIDWPGERGVFVKALIDCGNNGQAGLIDITPDGSRYIHDWYQYAGKLIEYRERDAERKRDIRRTSAGHPQDIQPESPKSPSVTYLPTNLPIPTDTNQPEPTDTDQPEPTNINERASAQLDGLTDTQRLVLSSFGAKRFKNHVQRDAILEWNKYPPENVKAAIIWAARKGFALGQAIESITSALPKWGAKPNGNKAETTMQTAIRKSREKELANGNAR